MKTINLVFAAMILLVHLSLYGIARMNYENALIEARMSEGTDQAIYEVMVKRGFTGSKSELVFEEPTYLEKVEAVVNVLTR